MTSLDRTKILRKRLKRRGGMPIPRRVSDLPIHAVLPDLLAALRGGSVGAVLIAPPGRARPLRSRRPCSAEPWCSGTVIVLSPRRVAARAAAERMAELLGEAAGETIGYLTRLDQQALGQDPRAGDDRGDLCFDHPGRSRTCGCFRRAVRRSARAASRQRSWTGAGDRKPGGAARGPAAGGDERDDRRRAVCRPAR